MSFNAGADAYDRFMGRYSTLLAPLFADFAGVAAGQRVLDVGCGPGALTADLVERLGATNVAAVDPTPSFVEAARARHPGVEVHEAPAEQLPFDDRSFDAALAQLVVHFMSDPVAGVREMARVTRERGTVAACVWDHEGDRGPLSSFWAAARSLDPAAAGDAVLTGSRAGELVGVLREAGLREVEGDAITLTVEHSTFEDWWEPYTLGVGPAGSYVAKLDAAGQERLREQCREILPAAPFALPARTWTARGIV